MSLYDTPEKRIAAALWFKNVKDNEYWKDMVRVMERDIYERLVTADSSEERIMVKAEAVILRRLPHQMQILIDAGELEIIQIANAVKKQEEKKKQ